jgi:kynurenine formamidase
MPVSTDNFYRGFPPKSPPIYKRRLDACAARLRIRHRIGASSKRPSGEEANELADMKMRAQLATRGYLFAVLLVLASTGASSPAAAQNNSLAEAYKIIASKQFVDLTHSFSPLTPVWKGFGQAALAAAADPATGRPYSIEHDGFHSTFYAMVGQYGTHIDPPAHFDPNGQTMDELPLKQMILPLVVFDITPMLAKDPNHVLTVDDIKAWERIHGRVPSGSFAALRTDMYKDWTSNPARFKRYPFPGWSLAAIQFLYDQRGIVANGHESMDTDTTPGLDSEAWLLRHGHWQIEVMANLDKVPASGSLIVVSWPKPEHGLGFPARAFAILP